MEPHIAHRMAVVPGASDAEKLKMGVVPVQDLTAQQRRHIVDTAMNTQDQVIHGQAVLT